MIQFRLSLTDQLQSLRPFTVTLLVPDPLPGLNDDGDKLVGEPGQGAACETLTLVSPIETVPERAVPVFAVTAIDTVPPPDTLEGVAVIQFRLSLTDHEQSLGPVTDTLLVPAPLPALTDEGDTLVGEAGQVTPVA